MGYISKVAKRFTFRRLCAGGAADWISNHGVEEALYQIRILRRLRTFSAGLKMAQEQFAFCGETEC